NRFALYKNLASPEKFIGSKNFPIAPIVDNVLKFAHDGVVDKAIFHALGDAYLATAEEFVQLFEDAFSAIDFVGLESFFAFQQYRYLEKHSDEHDTWLDLVEYTGRTIEGIHNAEHLLYIG